MCDAFEALSGHTPEEQMRIALTLVEVVARAVAELKPPATS